MGPRRASAKCSTCRWRGRAGGSRWHRAPATSSAASACWNSSTSATASSRRRNRRWTACAPVPVVGWVDGREGGRKPIVRFRSAILPINAIGVISAASSAARATVSAERNVDRARIFVSFAGEDRARAMELVRWLNDGGWHVVADDRHSFAVPDGSIPSARLDSCDVVLCVVTPQWLKSESCRREFSYCAKRGKFILPVICEPIDLDMLPPAVRALPRVDLRRNRLIDYLALKESLSQTGSKIARLA